MFKRKLNEHCILFTYRVREHLSLSCQMRADHGLAKLVKFMGAGLCISWRDPTLPLHQLVPWSRKRLGFSHFSLRKTFTPWRTLSRSSLLIGPLIPSSSKVSIYNGLHIFQAPVTTKGSSVLLCLRPQCGGVWPKCSHSTFLDLVFQVYNLLEFQGVLGSKCCLRTHLFWAVLAIFFSHAHDLPSEF